MPPSSPASRALRTVAPLAAAPAIVLGVVFVFAVGWIAGVIAFVVVGAAASSWVRFAGDHLVASRLRALGAREADPVGDARLCNLVEGLSAAAGVRQPRLLVLDSPGLNLMVAGSGPRRTVLAVTSSLLAELDRIELEAVLAEELYVLRHGEAAPATVLVATFGIGLSIMLGADRDAGADQGAVALTRYPPALASALEKVEAKGAAVAGVPPHMAQLWLADPRPSPPVSRSRLPLQDRIEALREL